MRCHGSWCCQDEGFWYRMCCALSQSTLQLDAQVPSMPATSVQRRSRCAPTIVWDPSQFSLVRDTRSGYETPPSAVDPPLSFPPLCTTERKRSHVPPPPLLRKLSHPVSAVTEAEVKSSRFFVLRFQNFGPASSWCSLVLATWAILTTLENFAAQTFAR